MVTLVSGNTCIIQDEVSGIIMLSQDFHSDEELESIIKRTNTKLRCWCYKHGIKVEDFDYQQMLRYEYYMEHAAEYVDMQRTLRQSELGLEQYGRRLY